MLGEVRRRAALRNPKGPRHGGNQQSRVLVGCDRQVTHSTLEGDLEFGGHGDREAGLTHSAKPGNGDQPPSLGVERGDQLADLSLSADEECDRSRNARNALPSHSVRTASGVYEGGPVGFGEAESHAEPGSCVGIRPGAHSAFDVANRASAHASAVGELLLRQPRLLAMASQQPPERGHQLDASRPTTR